MPVYQYTVRDKAGKVHLDNFPKARFYCEDLDAIVPHQVRKEVGSVDLILASPECTNHSPAKGGRPRCEKSKETAFHVVRFAEVFQPRWIVVENVISMRNWTRYQEFLNALKSLGYHHKEQVLDSSAFGVPQTRRRLFMLFDKKQEPPDIKPSSQSPLPASCIVNTNGSYSYSPLRREGRATATLQRAERAISSVGPNEPFLIVYYGSDQAGGWQRMERPLRTITTLDRFAYVKPTPQGHVMRMLQPEELKLAMGWPKGFCIEHGVRRDRIRMIGNAVCPKVMRAVVRQLTQRNSSKDPAND